MPTGQSTKSTTVRVTLSWPQYELLRQEAFAQRCSVPEALRRRAFPQPEPAEASVPRPENYPEEFESEPESYRFSDEEYIEPKD